MHIPQGHSVNQQQMERVGGPPPPVSADRQKPAGQGGGFAVKDVVDLSATAKSMVEAADQPQGPGKSMNSPAHQARSIIAEHGHLAGMSFGQVVSQLNQGPLDLTPPATDGDETGDSAAIGATETATVADVEQGAADPTSDPVVAAADPTPDPVIVTDPTPDPAVIVTDPTPDPAVVAADPTPDPVVVAADPTSDPVVVATDPTPAPVVVADTTSTLLDMLESDEDQAESDQPV